MTTSPTPDAARLAAAPGADGSASALVLAIDEAVEAQHQLEQQLRSAFGINNSDFRALLIVFRLRRRGLAAHPSDLTRALGISSGTASQIITRLSDAGLLLRSADPSDARSGILTLSEDADQRLANSTSALRLDLDRIIDSLEPSEERRIVDLLEQVRAAFSAHTERRRSGTPS